MEDEAVNDFTPKEIMRSHKEEHDALRAALNKAIRARHDSPQGAYGSKVQQEDIHFLLYHIADLEKAISAAHKILCQMDVDEESDIACYRDEAMRILKGTVK